MPIRPELAELLDDLVRERLRAVELLRDRRDLLLGEVAHRAPDQLVVVGEIEVHAETYTERPLQTDVSHATDIPTRSASDTTAASRRSSRPPPRCSRAAASRRRAWTS